MTMRRIFFATRPAILAVGLIFNFAAKAQTNGLSDAEIQGRQLARQLCEAKPTGNFTNTGTLKVRDEKGKNWNVPVEFALVTTDTNWLSFYKWFSVRNGVNTHECWEFVTIVHDGLNPNQYRVSAILCKAKVNDDPEQSTLYTNSLPDKTTVFGYHSDFWLCDLGLEFFHWPMQKILPHTTTLKRGREYTLLESTNPNPTTNGYSRVVSWIDKETGGILEAEAYDATGKLLKDFAPKSFKKVNGQWELQEMEIRNVQTGSRTRLEFDLPK